MDSGRWHFRPANLAPCHPEDTYRLRLLYGDWLVGLSEMLSSLAFDLTASGVRPSLRPITRVGVFWSDRCSNSFTSCLVQCVLWFAGFLAMVNPPYVRYTKVLADSIDEFCGGKK